MNGEGTMFELIILEVGYIPLSRNNESASLLRPLLVWRKSRVATKGSKNVHSSRLPCLKQIESTSADGNWSDTPLERSREGIKIKKTIFQLDFVHKGKFNLYLASGFVGSPSNVFLKLCFLLASSSLAHSIRNMWFCTPCNIKEPSEWMPHVKLFRSY